MSDNRLPWHLYIMSFALLVVLTLTLPDLLPLWIVGYAVWIVAVAIRMSQESPW